MSHQLLRNHLLCGFLALGLTTGCVDTTGEEPMLEEFVSNPGEWRYILGTDVGLRSDGLGLGHFQAPRGARDHTGLDILGTIGEPLLSPCDGVVATGFDGGFGNWAQVVCPIPPALAGGQTLYASLLYGHMNTFGPGTGAGYSSISAGQAVGTVGRSGNAASTNPHVHFEVVIHSSESAARAESHIGSNTSNNAAANTMVSAMTSDCLQPTGFQAVHGVRQGRRMDPFVFLTCVGAIKPAVRRPSSSLQSQFHPWSRYYSATGFNVDTGSPDTAVQFAPIEVYWARNDDGSYKLHALAANNVQSVEYFVDGFKIAESTRAQGDNFPATYTFTVARAERLFEVKGLDSAGEQVALGVGLMDVTDGTAVLIRQLGEGFYDIGLERAPAGVAYIEVRIDGFLLTDQIGGSPQSERGVVRAQLTTVGTRHAAISTFNADGSLRGTLHRDFTFR